MSNTLESITAPFSLVGKAGKEVKRAITPDMPKLPDPTAQATQADVSSSLAAEEARRQNARRRGRASTILTSSQGAAGSAQIGTNTLLGQ